MHAYGTPFAADHFITPMAAVAGSVAEEVLRVMLAAANLERAYVNNGGDIALHLTDGEQFTVGLMDRPDRHGPMRTLIVDADDPSRGIATSGRHGRSFSLGIADAVTVLARRAADADAAATLIANAVDVRDAAVTRRPARELDPDSDLQELAVTVGVGPLGDAKVAAALASGRAAAEAMIASGLIEGALLSLAGRWESVGV